MSGEDPCPCCGGTGTGAEGMRFGLNDSERLRPMIGELSVAWSDICKHTPSTYTCGDWNRMSTAVEALIAFARSK